MKLKYLILVICLGVSLTWDGCRKEEETKPVPRTPIVSKPILFAPYTYGSVKDVEGNVYKTIAIGNQTWMAENLRTSTFQDGSPIATNLTQEQWTSIKESAVCIYDDNAANSGLYGSLYNEYVKTDVRNVCPDGWHVPSTGDWTELTNHLGGIGVAGTKLKETGTDHWISPNTGDNISGFTGLPGGSRYRGRFNDIGYDGYWWSADPGKFFYLTNTEINLRTKSTGVSDDGLSIRCVKN